MSENLVSENPKTTLTAITTGLVGLSGIITNETAKNICTVISPAAALLAMFLFRNGISWIETRRGLSVYNTIIADLKKIYLILILQKK